MLTISNLTKKYGKITLIKPIYDLHCPNSDKTILLSTLLLDMAKIIANCYKIVCNGVIVAEPNISGNFLSISVETVK